MNEYSNNFFITGGTLPPRFPSYIKREADTKLYEQVKQGNFCYILTARQMGKSSLRANVMEELVKEGYACCAFDITQIGVNNINTDSWYFTFLDIINDQLKLDFDIAHWWETEGNITPVYRFFKFLKTVVLEKIRDKRIVFFFDEIDSLLSIDKTRFSTDDFFASIRGIYLERANNPEFNRLCFIVIGVASPNELMNDPARTPFNIGVSIQLENFSLEEAAVLKSGFHHLPYDADRLLREIINWSGGQPILTQKLCMAIAHDRDTSPEISEMVKRQVERLFLQQSLTHSDNTNLMNIQTRIIENDKYGMQMLNLYQAIYEKGWVKDDTADLGMIYLKLSGLVKIFNDKIIINNKIYKEKFNDIWIEDTRSLIDRPFNAALKEWIDNGKKNERVLRGDQLEEYNEWCNNRNDLTPQEKEFQTFSNNAKANEEAFDRMSREVKEQLERQENLVIQEKAKAEQQILASEKRIMASEKRRKNIIGGVVSVGLIAGITLFIYFTSLQKKIEEVDDARAKITELELQKVLKERQFKEDSAKVVEGAKQELQSLLAEKKSLEKQIKENEKLIDEAKKQKATNAVLAANYRKLQQVQDSLQQVQDSLQNELKQNDEKLRTINEQYMVLYGNRWLNNYDNEDISKIVKAYFNSDDTAAQKDMLRDFRELIDYGVIYTDDPNYALFSAFNVRETCDSALVSVVDKQVDKIAKEYFFYSKRQDILKKNEKDSFAADLTIKTRLSDNLFLATLYDENYFIVDMVKGERSGQLLDKSQPSQVYVESKERLIYILQSPKKGECILSVYDYQGKIVKRIPFVLAVSDLYDVQLFTKGNDTLAIIDNGNAKVTELSITSRRLKEISFTGIENDIRSKSSAALKELEQLVFKPEIIDYNSRTKEYILVYRLKNETLAGVYTYSDMKFKDITSGRSQTSYAGYSVTITKDKERVILTPPEESSRGQGITIVVFDLDGTRTSRRLPAYAYYMTNSPDQRFYLFTTNEDRIIVCDFDQAPRCTVFSNYIFDDYSEIKDGKMYSWSAGTRYVWDLLKTDNTHPFLREKYVLPFKQEFGKKKKEEAKEMEMMDD